MASSPEPILASWKISDVLARHPDLLDTLVDLSPAFAKLRNPLLRKVQTRLVTVAQAAGIAGLDPAALTRQLNQAAGITAPEPAGPAPSATPAGQEVVPAWAANAPVAQQVDARPLLARGEEPFRAIMAAARQVGPGEILRLTVGFEPLPLYDALGKQGFSHWSRQRDASTWVVDFHRDQRQDAPHPAHDASDGAWDEPATAEVTIDVSELVPPEPMMKILQALEELSPGGTLLVHHVRRPVYLYERLDEMGYPHQTRDLGPDRVELLIRKPAGQAS
jgi:uncharacterized protein (DUF2249 family)